MEFIPLSFGYHGEVKHHIHPQMVCQVERTMKILEYMLRDYIIDFKGNWDMHLPLVEISYNNNYHSSISMDSCEALYDRIYRY